MSMGSFVTQALLYGMRPTIGETHTISVTNVETTKTLKAGLYLITNVGADPCNLRMFPPSGGTYVVTTSDFVLSPLGSGDRSEIEVLVRPSGRDTLSLPINTLHAITPVGKTATLLVTRISMP